VEHHAGLQGLLLGVTGLWLLAYRLFVKTHRWLPVG